MWKKLLGITVLIVLATTFSCGGKTQLQSCPTDSVECHSKAHFKILMDQNLSETHKLLICTALAEWDIKTNNSLSYYVEYKDMSEVPNDLSGDDNTIKVYITKLDPSHLGWTEWKAEQNRARVLLTTGMNDDTFYPVVLHELGHAFNIGHYTGPYKAVMHPSIGNTNKLECPDLMAFCEEWGCQVDCINESIESYDPKVDAQNICTSLEAK